MHREAVKIPPEASIPAMWRETRASASGHSAMSETVTVQTANQRRIAPHLFTVIPRPGLIGQGASLTLSPYRAKPWDA